MVSRDVPLNRLISWSRNFNVDKDENILNLFFYVGADDGNYTGALGDREYKIIPDEATINRLKTVRNQIIALLQNTVQIEGDIEEIWEIQEVEYPSEMKLERVKL